MITLLGCGKNSVQSFSIQRVQQSVKNYRNKYLKHSRDYRTNDHLCLRESQMFVHVRT